jgi:hypothetical protein
MRNTCVHYGLKPALSCSSSLQAVVLVILAGLAFRVFSYCLSRPNLNTGGIETALLCHCIGLMQVIVFFQVQMVPARYMSGQVHFMVKQFIFE